MTHSIMVGCDLHDKTMLLKIAEGREKPETRSVKNTAAGRVEMIRWLRERALDVKGGEVVFAYEASGQGFGLYDELTEAGFTCYVLAPTKIARSIQHRRRKTDEQDALQILELLKAHVLAGNPLPKIWIPDPQTRDDRQLVRMRLDVGEKLTSPLVNTPTSEESDGGQSSRNTCPVRHQAIAPSSDDLPHPLGP